MKDFKREKHFLELYGIFDSCLGEYRNLMLFKNSTVAVRAFQHMLNSDSIPFKDDFKLFFVAYFDPNSGSLYQISSPTHVLVDSIEPKVEDLTVLDEGPDLPFDG